MVTRRLSTLFAALVVSALGLTAAPASAHVQHTTAAGKPVRWAQASVDFVISPSLAHIAPDAVTAVAAAMSGWSGIDGAPTLRVQLGDGTEKPAVDGHNVVYFAPEGYPSARGALAITLLSYDETTGEIVDADIVINGNHPLAVLPDGSQARGKLAPTDVATGVTASARDDDEGAFDLLHVVMHETGHALGLRDEPDVTAAAMFPFAYRNDATRREPTTDDLAGIATAYGAPATAAAATGPHGCSASPTSSRGGAAGPALAAALALLLMGGARRRRPPPDRS
jgi:MYXO-CTERM domain-containing protein